MFFAKLALFLLYYRIFALNRWMKIAIYLGILINFLIYLSSIIVLGVLCTPQQHKSWNSPAYAARCQRSLVMGEILGIFGLVSDLYIYILPLPVVFRLHMSLKKKIGVTAVFLTGLM